MVVAIYLGCFAHPTVLDIRALYKHCVRKVWQTIPGHAYHAKVVDVGLNLAENNKAPEQWVKVCLQFVQQRHRHSRQSR